MSRLGAAVILMAVAGAGVLVVPHLRGRRTIRTVALRVLLGKWDEAIEFGWDFEPARPGRGIEDRSYYHFLSWEHRDEKRTFLVFEHGDPPWPDIELRANRDHTRVWLVEQDLEDRVIASLDLATGEFKDVNGQVRDGRKSLREQAAESGDGDLHGPATWASPNGGELLAHYRQP
jgi:hypothetical protein